MKQKNNDVCLKKMFFPNIELVGYDIYLINI